MEAQAIQNLLLLQPWFEVLSVVVNTEPAHFCTDISQG